MIEIVAEPLTQDAFAPFGDVLEAVGKPDKIINAGFCGRWHDRAALDFGDDGRAGMSVFKAEPRALPYTLDMVERHPDGCQAFVPMSMDSWLVTVAEDEGGKPVPVGAQVQCSAPSERSFTQPGIVGAGTRSGTHIAQSGTSSAAPQFARDLVRKFLREPPRSKATVQEIFDKFPEVVRKPFASPKGPERLGKRFARTPRSADAQDENKRIDALTGRQTNTA